MLGALRKRKQSPIIAFLLGLIIIVFVAFFGNSWNSCANQRSYAAKVNGQVISAQENDLAYSSEFRSRQAQDPKYDRERAKREDLRQTVINRQITQVLLAQDARRRGLAVDDRALADAIKSNPNFQANGRFDRTIYERFLNSEGMSDTRFENQLRQGLLVQKVASILENGVSISEAEAREAFYQEKRRINVEFVTVPKTAYEPKVKPPTPAEADEWLKKPGSEDEVQKFYTRHLRSRYNVPKQVCAQHILLRAEKEMPPDLRKKAREKISDAVKAMKDGMDFGEAARKFSEDSTKDKGGDLGCFSLGQMVPQFEEAAFGLKPGELSGVVETAFGFHVIKVNEVKPPVEKKLEDVKQAIAIEVLTGEKASALAKQRAEEILAAAKGAKTLAEALKEAKGSDPVPLKAEETGPFPKHDFIPHLGVSKDAMDAAWKLTPDQPLTPAPIDTEQGWVILRLNERLEPTDEEFQKDRKMLALSLEMQKRNSVIKAWTEMVRKKAKIDIHPITLSYDDEVRARERNRGQ